MSALTPDENLALMVALDKSLNDRTHGKLTLAKAEAQNAVLEDARAGRSDRRPLMVGGEKVGEVGVNYAKPGIGIRDGMMGEALDYLDNIGEVDVRPSRGWQENFRALDDGTVVCVVNGEVVDWACVTRREPISASVRGCKPDVVLRAIAPRLSSADAGIIGMLNSGEAE